MEFGLSSRLRRDDKPRPQHKKRVSQKGHPFFFSLLSLSFAPPKESNQRKRVRKRQPFLFFANCALPFPAPKNSKRFAPFPACPRASSN